MVTHYEFCEKCHTITPHTKHSHCVRCLNRLQPEEQATQLIEDATSVLDIYRFAQAEDFDPEC